MEKEIKKLVAVPIDEKLRFNFRLECLKKNISMSKVLKAAIRDFVEGKKNQQTKKP